MLLAYQQYDRTLQARARDRRLEEQVQPLLMQYTKSEATRIAEGMKHRYKEAEFRAKHSEQLKPLVCAQF